MNYRFHWRHGIETDHCKSTTFSGGMGKSSTIFGLSQSYTVSTHVTLMHLSVNLCG